MARMAITVTSSYFVYEGFDRTFAGWAQPVSRGKKQILGKMRSTGWGPSLFAKLVYI